MTRRVRDALAAVTACDHDRRRIHAVGCPDCWHADLTRHGIEAEADR